MKATKLRRLPHFPLPVPRSPAGTGVRSPPQHRREPASDAKASDQRSLPLSERGPLWREGDERKPGRDAGVNS